MDLIRFISEFMEYVVKEKLNASTKKKLKTFKRIKKKDDIVLNFKSLNIMFVVDFDDIFTIKAKDVILNPEMVIIIILYLFSLLTFRKSKSITSQQKSFSLKRKQNV